MDGLTAEQRELDGMAAKLLADAEAKNPLPPAWEALPLRLDRALWASFADVGLLGLTAPDSGAGLLELLLVAERMGASVPPVPFVGASAVAVVLARAEHAALDPMVSGEQVIVPAWETWPVSVVPGRRADALVSSGPSQVTGVLRAVPFGLDADQVLVFLQDGSAALVPLAGAERTSVDSLDVMEPLAEVSLRDAPSVPVSLPVFPLAEVLLLVAAELVGVGRRALDGAVEYAGQRRQFGRPIGSFQSIKHMLADRFVQLDAARMLVRAADASEIAARTALVAASDAADAATADALQVHGGIGFTWEHVSHVLLKRSRARRVLLGSQARQLDALADHLLTP
ncbi:acyl-CoA dehydrogenase family protein [Pseudonocardia spinosispora]|uniref:acyl-CoA dehydrogenase family protein n=1 Tax=Pseudonocardia spinosispora TaxID=103441 RepID=UPI000410E28C|nr:acyl-CoA dehydrogenase family protein [Pseudonocardia spinosispora]